MLLYSTSVRAALSRMMTCTCSLCTFILLSCYTCRNQETAATISPFFYKFFKIYVIMLKRMIKNIHLSVSDGSRGVLEAAPDSALFKILWSNFDKSSHLKLCKIYMEPDILAYAHHLLIHPSETRPIKYTLTWKHILHPFKFLNIF